MTNEPHHDHDSVHLPAPTAAPLVLGLGIALLAVGVVMGVAMLLVGGVVFSAGLGIWINQLLPGRGHAEEPLVHPAHRAAPIAPTLGAVRRLSEGMPGYRVRLPEKMHPLSAGLKGGMVGGLLMSIPALAYGVLSGHGLWLPVNLLAGMVLPGVDAMTLAQLEKFSLTLLLVAAVIHVVTSVVLGLILGVLLPTLPDIPRPLAWGALLMPVLWSAASFVAMGQADPLLRARVDWPWFIASQFVFGVVSALVFLRASRRSSFAAGLLGGVAGGLMMPIPAVLWSLLTGHGIWYPVNLLAGLFRPQALAIPLEQLEQLHPEWLLQAVAIHAALSITFGMFYGLLLPKLPNLSAPLAWGGLLMPLLWTGASYGLMGVVNPVLQELVAWPWFIVSQFIYGLAAAIVVERSEQIHIPPAGQAPESAEEYLVG